MNEKSEGLHAGMIPQLYSIWVDESIVRIVRDYRTGSCCCTGWWTRLIRVKRVQDSLIKTARVHQHCFSTTSFVKLTSLHHRMLPIQWNNLVMIFLVNRLLDGIPSSSFGFYLKKFAWPVPAPGSFKKNSFVFISNSMFSSISWWNICSRSLLQPKLWKLWQYLAKSPIVMPWGGIFDRSSAAVGILGASLRSMVFLTRIAFACMRLSICFVRSMSVYNPVPMI